MKKITFFLCAVSFLVSTAKVFAQEMVQDEAKIKRVWVWEIPKTSKISLSKIATDSTTRILAASTATGNGCYMLLDSLELNDIDSFFHSDDYQKALALMPKNVYLGYCFSVAYIETYSWLTDKQLNSKKLKISDKEKRDLLAFNSSAKYRMMGQNPRIAYGEMNKDFEIVPTLKDFSVQSQPVDTVKPVPNPTPEKDSLETVPEQNKKIVPPQKRRPSNPLLPAPKNTPKKRSLDDFRDNLKKEKKGSLNA